MRLTQFITIGAEAMIVLSVLFAAASFMIGRSADDAVKAVMSSNVETLEQSREQAQAIGEIDASVNELEKMTQNNAALAEQTNSAIGRMDQRVKEMEALVNLFRLSGTGDQGVSQTGRAA